MKIQELDIGLRIRIIPTNPKIGLVIGTFGSPAYIHLFLKVAQTHFPDIPILIHDDRSDFKKELEVLASAFGHSFSTNENRKGHGAGDIIAFCKGLEWATRLHLDILVKMSRRFIPLFNWTPSLLETAIKSQHITYANKCNHFKFPIRSECVGLYVPKWMEKLNQFYELAQDDIKVEQDLMEFVKKFDYPTCFVNESYNYNYYGVWDRIGDNRMTKCVDIMWHDCYNPMEYFSKATEYGIKGYDLKDFFI